MTLAHDTAIVVLPEWSIVTEKRRAHIARVVALLAHWADAMRIDAEEREGWRDAGLWHDALRDADEHQLREATGDAVRPVGMLHGFAAALRLEREGETRDDVISAVRWHTIGQPTWCRTGKALYMADFLEPGRTFMQADRAFMARQVPFSFDDVFRQVVRMRIEWALREGKGLAPETVAMWNAVR